MDSSHQKNPDTRSETFWQIRTRSLLDSLNVGYVLVDMDENILDVNETLLMMTGARRDQVVGRNNRELYTREEYNRLLEIALPLQEKGMYQFEFALPCADGNRIPALYNSYINTDEQNRPVSINVMITDIRRQKDIQAELENANQALMQSRTVLEKEKKTLETILFGIGDCVTIFDPKGDIVLSTPQGMAVRGGRRKPLLPLRSGDQRALSLDVNGESRNFSARVEAVRDGSGAPFAYVEVLQDVTDHLRLEERERELFRIKREMRRREISSDMIGISPAMQKVFDLILRCAEVESSILVLGETGVGKELAARAIHAQSARRRKPFVAVNCGALPETLLESELFGHVKGAFTGAVSDRLGLFREAHGGTLFLDEIGDLSGPLQVKLLRALQEREIRPVGGNRNHAVDARVITATNKDLGALVRDGSFRHDLYYRIAVILVNIPPLRERREDILPLAEYFLQKHRPAKVRRPVTVDQSAQELLTSYAWPGNVRELENAIEHAVAMARGSHITPETLPFQLVTPPPVNESPSPPDRSTAAAVTSDDLRTDLAANVEAAERKAIRQALERHKWNRTLAARDLGISRITLWRRMRLHGLD